MPKTVRQQRISDRNLPQGTKLHYYTLLDGKMNPRATVCLVILDKIIARGISLCSRSEFLEAGFKDEDGRTRARHRAYKAWNVGSDVKETVRLEAWKAIAEIPLASIGVRSYADQYEFFRFKGAYDVKLTSVEKRLIGA